MAWESTTLSEYQYYEFLAADRPLDERQQAELRAISTRADVTATSFVNEYHWGSFRGDPLRQRYGQFMAASRRCAHRSSLRDRQRRLGLGERKTARGDHPDPRRSRRWRLSRPLHRLAAGGAVRTRRR